MNITNPRFHYTAGFYLDLSAKNQLESDINTIFSKLKNTEPF